MTSKHLPHYAEGHAAESGDLMQEIAVGLVEAVTEQNAILDDTIHTELKRIADSQARIAESMLGIEQALNQIVRHYVVGI